MYIYIFIYICMYVYKYIYIYIYIYIYCDAHLSVICFHLIDIMLPTIFADKLFPQNKVFQIFLCLVLLLLFC